MKKVAFIGQAPPKTEPGRPFGRTPLYKWLAEIDITDEIIKNYIGFFALIDYFPGLNKNKGHLVPSKLQINEARPKLIKKLLEFNPNIIVSVGKISTEEALGRKVLLDDVVGKKFVINFYAKPKETMTLIPFPHPSGASTWIFQNDNRELLTKALYLLKEEFNS